VFHEVCPLADSTVVQISTLQSQTNAAIAGTELAGADIPSAQPMRSAYLSLSVDSDAEAERIFAALADGGEVLMKLEETFFASRFGQVRDRFGINWMILRQRPMQA